MPTIEISGLKQLAILWPFAGSFNSKGEPRVSEMLDIRVRWERGIQQALENDEGPVFSNAIVMVDRAIQTAGIILLVSGSNPDPDITPTSAFLAGASGQPGFEEESGYSPITGYLEVVDYREIPDVKARRFQRTVALRRWKRALPEIVS